MIVFDLCCDQEHRFECWFRSSDDFANQKERALLICPQCGSSEITKAPMAPAVPAKSNQRSEAAASAAKPVAGGEIPPEVRKAMQALADAQARALKDSRYVGDGFAEESRAMHYGEKELEVIHGKATLNEARELLEEGVPLAPLLATYFPPDELN